MSRHGHYKEGTKADYMRRYNVKRFAVQKLAVMAHYSQGSNACQCCGEQNLEFLTIDHSTGDGRIHRQSLKSRDFYGWLVRQNYPEGYRVLCMNCNFALGHFGYCPHKSASPGKASHPVLSSIGAS
jgi:hypothetical protein